MEVSTLALLKIASHYPPYQAAIKKTSELFLRGTEKAKIRLEDSSKEFLTHWMRGPYFDLAYNTDIEVLARYTDAKRLPKLQDYLSEFRSVDDRTKSDSSGLPAAVAGEKGEGRVALSGVHPEMMIDDKNETIGEANLEFLKLLGRKANMRFLKND